MATLMLRCLQIVRYAAAPFLYSCAFLPMAYGQEPAKIVDQYVKAAGGSRALSKIQTLALEGTFTTGDGNRELTR